MSESMIVYVTPADLEEIRRLQAEAEISGDQTKLAGFIQGCCTLNGGTFSRERALRGVNTQLHVMRPAEHVQIKLTVAYEEPLNGKEG